MSATVVSRLAKLEERMAKVEQRQQLVGDVRDFETWQSHGYIHTRIDDDTFTLLQDDKGTKFASRCLFCRERIAEGTLHDIWYCWKTRSTLHEACIPLMLLEEKSLLEDD